MLLVYFTQKVVGLPANRPLFDFLTKSGKVVDFPAERPLFLLFQKWSLGRPSDHFGPVTQKVVVLPAKRPLFDKKWQSGRFFGKPTTLGSYCCYETLVLCYCCYGILVLLCYCVITVQQCYAVKVAYRGPPTRG